MGYSPVVGSVGECVGECVGVCGGERMALEVDGWLVEIYGVVL